MFPSNTILWEIHFHGNSITFANTPLEDNPTTRPVVFQFSSRNASTGGVSVSNLLISGVFRGWSRSWWEMFGDDIEIGLEALNNFPAKKRCGNKNAKHHQPPYPRQPIQISFVSAVIRLMVPTQKVAIHNATPSQ